MPHAAFEWQGHEYAIEDRSADWYWALGIVATGAAITAVLFGNVLFALVIALGTAAIALEAAKQPALHQFALSEHGIQIGSRIYPFENILSFSFVEYLDETLPPALSIKTTSIFAPHLMIPITDVDPIAIFDFLETHVPHEPHEPTFTDHLSVWLRL